MSFVESLSVCLFPALALVVGIGLTLLVNRFSPNLLLRFYFLGVIVGTMVVPLCQILFYVLIAAICLIQQSGSFLPATPNNFDYARSFGYWLEQLLHLGLASFGLPGDAAILLGLVFGKIPKFQASFSKIELGLIATLSLAGWVTLFLWPLPNYFSFQPSL